MSWQLALQIAGCLVVVASVAFAAVCYIIYRAVQRDGPEDWS